LKLTPIEIRKQEFKKSMRGYDTVEIDTFIELIANEYENLIKENENLNKKLISMESELKHFKENEKTLKQTLYKVQETSQLSKENSEREATLIRKEADLHAAQITEKARAELYKLQEEMVALKQQKASFVARLRHLLSSQIELIEVLSVDDDEIGSLKDRSRRTKVAQQKQNILDEKAKQSQKTEKNIAKENVQSTADVKKTDQKEIKQTDKGKKPGHDFFKDIFNDNLDSDDI
jgi:cell division initiation protein